MSYTFNLYDGSKLNLGDLQIRGITGSKLIQEVKKYFNWLELSAIQRSDDPKIQEFIGLNIQKGNIDELLKTTISGERKSQLSKQLEDLENQIADCLNVNAMKISQATSNENVDIERAFDIFTKVLRNLKPDIQDSYLDSDNYSYEEVMSFLKTVIDVKNNDMKSFLTASNM